MKKKLNLKSSQTETVLNIIHYDDGSFDIITDKATYKECRVNEKYFKGKITNKNKSIIVKDEKGRIIK